MRNREVVCFLQLRSIVLESLLQFVPCKDIKEGTLWSRILQALQMFAWHFVTFFSLKEHQRVNCIRPLEEHLNRHCFYQTSIQVTGVQVGTLAAFFKC